VFSGARGRAPESRRAYTSQAESMKLRIAAESNNPRGQLTKSHLPKPALAIATLSHSPPALVPLRRSDERHTLVKNPGSHRVERVGPANSALILQNDGTASVRHG
jgi:hypothetical protein